MAEKLELMKKAIGQLRGAWQPELAPYTDADVWVAYLDCLCDFERNQQELGLTELLAKLAGNANAE